MRLTITNHQHFKDTIRAWRDDAALARADGQESLAEQAERHAATLAALLFDHTAEKIDVSNGDKCEYPRQEVRHD